MPNKIFVWTNNIYEIEGLIFKYFVTDFQFTRDFSNFYESEIDDKYKKNLNQLQSLNDKYKNIKNQYESLNDKYKIIKNQYENLNKIAKSINDVIEKILQNTLNNIKKIFNNMNINYDDNDLSIIHIRKILEQKINETKKNIK